VKNMTDKLLLVDDEEGIRTVLDISLSEMGYEVYTAENADAAIRVFSEVQAPIVLTDIKMPGMDGIELLRHLKKENPDTEVILITGHGDMDLAIKSVKYEATDFITKPIDDSELENALQKAHERIRLRQQWRSYTERLEHLVKQKSDQMAAGAHQMANEGQFQRFFDELPGYVTVLDKDFKIMAANRALKTDFEIEDPTDTYCYELFKSSDEPCLNCPVAKTFESGQSDQAELQLPASGGGEPRQMFAWTTPLFDTSNQTSRVMMMMTDISQVLDLKDHLASLGLMVGSVSHGIKGLLTGLDAGVYMLNTGYSQDDSEQVNEGLKTVKTMSERIKHMVLDILYYAREMKLNKQPVGIESFADEVIDVVLPRIEEAGIALNREIDESLANDEFSVDADQLRAAMVNILENAVDACSEDTQKGSHQIDFRVYRQDEAVCFEIEDNGIGMDQETQNNIFNLFYSSKATSGTGIGLFITKKIIGQHDGTIDVRSTPGEGSRFFIRLPQS